eukprot:IDg5913t1
MTERWEYNAKCVHEQSCVLCYCNGCINETKVKMARPGRPNCNQSCVYTKHKRCPCLMYQIITTPDGINSPLFCLVERRRLDAYVLLKSGFGARPEANIFLQMTIRGVNETEEQLRFKKDMSSGRFAVDWSYGEVKSLHGIWNSRTKNNPVPTTFTRE